MPMQLSPLGSAHLERSVLGCNGDAPLLLELVAVHHTVLAAAEKTGTSRLGQMQMGGWDRRAAGSVQRQWLLELNPPNFLLT